MSIRKLNLTILVVLLVGLSAIFAWDRLSIQRVSAEDKNVYENLQIFSDVLDIVKENYVQEVDDKELVEGAISGMLRTLDHTHLTLIPTLIKSFKWKPRAVSVELVSR